jgi:hypothetical protein
MTDHSRLFDVSVKVAGALAISAAALVATSVAPSVAHGDTVSDQFLSTLTNSGVSGIPGS